MKKYDTVIFDLDGTLLNTLTDLTDAVNYALAKCGLPLRKADEVRQYLGDGYKLLIERAAGGGTDCLDTAYAHFTEYYSQHMEDNTSPYDGVLDALKKLHAAGKKTAIVSNKGDAAVKVLCRKFFYPYIAEYYGVTDAMPKKPAPDMLFAAMKKLGADKSTTVMLGDGEADIEMARGAGIDIISVSWGYRTREFLHSNGADKIIDDISELNFC